MIVTMIKCMSDEYTFFSVEPLPRKSVQKEVLDEILGEANENSPFDKKDMEREMMKTTE